MTAKKRESAQDGTSVRKRTTRTVRKNPHAGSRISITVSSDEGRITIREVLKLGEKVTVRTIRQGLTVQKVDLLSERLRVSKADALRLIGLPRQTFNRRKAAGRLTAEESDRVVRYAELIARAIDLMGDEAAAATWLSTPAPSLGNDTPLDHATTELGAREVLQLIGRLEHGIPV
ncbi:MAG: antitoxin Xre/MbcA/ParS toxin-binding domain-containing protein [Pseudomonadales bacterium]